MRNIKSWMTNLTRGQKFSLKLLLRGREVVGMARANWAVLDSRCVLSDG
jgi:hypothetical protein